jgi:hypothetical protein
MGPVHKLVAAFCYLELILHNTKFTQKEKFLKTFYFVIEQFTLVRLNIVCPMQFGSTFNKLSAYCKIWISMLLQDLEIYKFINITLNRTLFVSRAFKL